jgi:hypothetical protein
VLVTARPGRLFLAQTWHVILGARWLVKLGSGPDVGVSTRSHREGGSPGRGEPGGTYMDCPAPRPWRHPRVPWHSCASYGLQLPKRENHLMTVHVVVDQGVLSWIVAVCTVIAALGALAAIVISLYLARKATTAQIVERRRVFELGVLVKVAELVGHGDHRYQDSNNPVGLVLRALPAEDFPTLRQMIGAPGDAPYRAELDGRVMQTFGQEFREATERRMSARN